MAVSKALVDALADILEELLPILSDLNVKSALERELQAGAAEIEKTLEWTGQKGYLIEVPIAEHPSTNQLELGKLRMHGAGPAQAETLALSLSRRHSWPWPEHPKFYSDEKSFYLWYDAESKKFWRTSHPLSQAVRNQALAIDNDQVVREALTEREHDKNLEHALKTLEQKVADAGVRENVARIASEIKKTKFVSLRSTARCKLT